MPLLFFILIFCIFFFPLSGLDFFTAKVFILLSFILFSSRPLSFSLLHVLIFPFFQLFFSFSDVSLSFFSHILLLTSILLSLQLIISFFLKVIILLHTFLSLFLVVLQLFLHSPPFKFPFLSTIHYFPPSNFSSTSFPFRIFFILFPLGFGDFVPAQKLKDNVELSIALCSIYLLFGIALLAMSFNLVQEEVISNVKSMARRLGILKEEEEEEDLD